MTVQMSVSQLQSFDKSHSLHDMGRQHASASAPATRAASSSSTEPKAQSFDMSQSLHIVCGCGDTDCDTASQQVASGVAPCEVVAESAVSCWPSGQLTSEHIATAGASGASGGEGDATPEISNEMPSTRQSSGGPSGLTLGRVLPCTPIRTVADTFAGIVSWASVTSLPIPAANESGIMAKTAPSMTSKPDVSVHDPKSMPTVPSVAELSPSTSPTVSQESKAAFGS